VIAAAITLLLTVSALSSFLAAQVTTKAVRSSHQTQCNAISCEPGLNSNQGKTAIGPSVTICLA
jgi:hypothetical protein